MTYKVDVLLSTFNGEKYLSDQIQSLIEQTYNDFLILIRDDGSCDATFSIIQEFKSKYPKKIQIVETDDFTGSAKCGFFKLMEVSSSDYSFFCDQDDVWEKDKIERVMSCIENLNKVNDPLLVHHDLRVVDENLNIINDSFADYQKLNCRHNSLNYLLAQNNVTGCTCCINKKLREICLKCDPSRVIMHDYWFALAASAFGTIIYIKEPLVDYRQHHNNSVGAVDFGLQNTCTIIHKNLLTMRESTERSYSQAEYFRNIYSDLLSAEQENLINLYLKSIKANIIEKTYLLIKYRFWKSGIFRKIGQMAVSVYDSVGK